MYSHMRRKGVCKTLQLVRSVPGAKVNQYKLPLGTGRDHGLQLLPVNVSGLVRQVGAPLSLAELVRTADYAAVQKIVDQGLYYRVKVREKLMAEALIDLHGKNGKIRPVLDRWVQMRQ